MLLIKVMVRTTASHSCFDLALMVALARKLVSDQTVADPDLAFGGAVKLGGAKIVFTCLNTKDCLRQKWLPFVGQKVAILVGRNMLFFTE